MDDRDTEFIDATRLSLADLEGLPDSAIVVALREVISEDHTVASARFSSGVWRRDDRSQSELPS